MNSELQHSLYGGEISDYLTPQLPAQNHKQQHNNLGPDLESIYNQHVANKGSIDTTGLVSANINLNGLIERQEADPLMDMFRQTLSKVAQEINIEGEPVLTTNNVSTLLQPKNQSQDDIHQAQDAVQAALAELKELGAL